MTSITATTPYTQLPAWAVLERRLFDLLDAAVDPFLDKYTDADGTLIWRDAATEGYPSRDGADDFYESFGNWPLYYLLGGGDRLLPLSHRHWDAVTRQLTSYGVLSGNTSWATTSSTSRRATSTSMRCAWPTPATRCCASGRSASQASTWGLTPRRPTTTGSGA